MLVKETDRMPSAWLFVVLGIFSGVGNRLLHGLTQAIAARIAPDGRGGFCAVRPLHLRRFRMDNRAVEEVEGTYHFKHDMWLSKLSPAVLIKELVNLQGESNTAFKVEADAAAGISTLLPLTRSTTEASLEAAKAKAAEAAAAKDARIQELKQQLQEARNLQSSKPPPRNKREIAKEAKAAAAEKAQAKKHIKAVVSEVLSGLDRGNNTVTMAQVEAAVKAAVQKGGDQVEQAVSGQVKKAIRTTQELGAALLKAKQPQAVDSSAIYERVIGREDIHRLAAAKVSQAHHKLLECMIKQQGPSKRRRKRARSPSPSSSSCSDTLSDSSSDSSDELSESDYKQSKRRNRSRRGNKSHRHSKRSKKRSKKSSRKSKHASSSSSSSWD